MIEPLSWRPNPVMEDLFDLRLPTGERVEILYKRGTGSCTLSVSREDPYQWYCDVNFKTNGRFGTSKIGDTSALGRYHRELRTATGLPKPIWDAFEKVLDRYQPETS